METFRRPPRAARRRKADDEQHEKCASHDEIGSAELYPAFGARLVAGGARGIEHAKGGLATPKHRECEGGYTGNVRVLGIDLGARRIGLAISDRSRTLARPLTTLAIGARGEALGAVVREIDRLAAEEDGLSAVVVGMPARLDGTESGESAHVAAFVTDLRTRIALPIAIVDERLTSREAESRLAVRERDWRVRKEKLDAAAAAIILQDYLDGQA